MHLVNKVLFKLTVERCYPEAIRIITLRLEELVICFGKQKAVVLLLSSSLTCSNIIASNTRSSLCFSGIVQIFLVLIIRTN